MKRKDNWEILLAEILQDRLHVPFQWGKHDCCLFAADCVEAMTGWDPARWFRSRYDSKVSAYAALKEFAGGSVAEVAEKICQQSGFALLDVPFGQRGDVALVEGNGSDALGVIDLTGMNILVAGMNGLEMVSINKGKKIWRI